MVSSNPPMPDKGVPTVRFVGTEQVMAESSNPPMPDKGVPTGGGY